MQGRTVMAKKDPELLLIGAFAKLAGTNLRTLRYYEERGLFKPARRSRGGFRYYRRTDVNRLKVIQGFQELGLTLERIGELLSTRDADTSKQQRLDRVQQALEAQENLLSQQVERIQARRERLQEARGKLTQCGPCPHEPVAENNYCEPCLLTGLALPEQLSALF